MFSASPTRIALFYVGLASLLFLGATDAYADIINGGFETGDFTGWTCSGFFDRTCSPSTGGPNFATFLAAQAATAPEVDTNAVVMSQTTALDGNGPFASPPIGPTEGRFLAFVSNQTDAGDASLTGSSI